MKFRSQSGSVHIVIVIVLVVVLLGALGFIFYQNFVQKQPATTNISNQIASKKVETLTAQYFTIDYPVDAGIQKSTIEGSAEYFEISKKGIDASVNVFREQYMRYGSGTPAVVDQNVAVRDWYAQQGKERAATDGDAPGSAHGGYAYKLTRYRGQVNNAVIYVLNGSTLYEISVQEDNGAELLDVNLDGSASYKFSAEIKQILASFKAS